MNPNDCNLHDYVQVVFKERHGGEGYGDVRDYFYPVVGYLTDKNGMGITVSFYDPDLEKEVPDVFNPIDKFGNQVFIRLENIVELYKLVKQPE